MANLAQIVGIIAEYHPFHNGHLYQMEQAKRLCGARWCVVLLSGSFVQRGIPALYSTRLRAEAALRCGADAVFELPSPFSSASARDYALCGVRLAAGLGVPVLSCGTESASEEEIMGLARLLDEESPLFRRRLKEELKSGRSYPEAQSAAAEESLKKEGEAPALLARCRELLSQPNHILALAYARAIRKERLPLRMLTVPRKGPGHRDDLLSGGFAPAGAIRRRLLAGEEPSALASVMPEASLRLLKTARPLSPDVLCAPLWRRVRTLLHEGQRLSDYADVSEDLARRIAAFSFRRSSFEELVNALKSRQYTHTRVSRALIHLFLGIRKEEMLRWKETNPAPYARLLGFRRSSGELLTLLRKSASIPMLSKAADAGRVLTSPDALRLFQAEIHADELRSSLCFEQHLSAPEPLLRQTLLIV